MDEHAKKVAREELNEPEDAASALAAFSASVIEALGAAEAERFLWAQKPTLRQCKWDTARALQKMRDLSAFAARRPELFADAAPADFLGQAALGMMSHLPTRTANGELVIVLHAEKLADYAASEYTMSDMLRFSVFYMRRMMEDERTQVHGVIMLENLANYPMFAMNKMKGAGPSGMKASFDWLGVSPLRLRGIYGCHTPWYVGMMLAMVKPFMSKKLRDRVSLHDKDTAAMLAEAGLDPKDVPPEYGGTLQGFDYGWHLKG